CHGTATNAKGVRRASTSSVRSARRPPRNHAHSAGRSRAGSSPCRSFSSSTTRATTCRCGITMGGMVTPTHVDAASTAGARGTS
ncbi:MAG: hypothetical protein AVDCRST_MAG88-2224, partial [uncultured Thermomicrobiales bacterium]